MKRLQLLIELCFSTTIYKAQGYTLNVADRRHTVQCLSHGQLYVTLSRVSCHRNLFVLVPKGKALNMFNMEKR